MYTDNPIRDAANHNKAEERWLSRRPICCNCGERIQDDIRYVINCESFCYDCLLDVFGETIKED